MLADDFVPPRATTARPRQVRLPAVAHPGTERIQEHPGVRFPLDIAERLRVLSADAETPGGILADGLDSLLAASVHAVPSLLALSLTVTRNGTPCTVSARAGRETSTVRSSLWLRLPGHAGAAFTVQAADEGALDQLGADLPNLLDVHRDRVVLSEHLTPSTEDAATLAHELCRRHVKTDPGAATEL